MKAKLVKHDDGSLYGVSWFCPGCKDKHHVPTTGEVAWSFNGDLEHPTITPSILIYGRKAKPDDKNPCEWPRCHSIVTDGRVSFCADSEHELAGKTVDLSELP